MFQMPLLQFSDADVEQVIIDPPGRSSLKADRSSNIKCPVP